MWISLKELGARKGVEREVANGVTIPNLGEQKILARMQKSFQKHIKAQVCDVSKALLSVKRLVEMRSRAIFDSGGSSFEDLYRGERMNLVEKGGLYVLKVWTRAGEQAGFLKAERNPAADREQWPLGRR